MICVACYPRSGDLGYEKFKGRNIMAPAAKWSLIALAIIVVLPIVLFAILSLSARRPSNLGPVQGKLRPCPNSPNCVCSCDASEGHSIAPLVWKGEPQAGLDRLIKVIQSLPRTTCEPVQEHRYFHAEFKSALFRFVDDIEFLVDPDAQVIHVRSASRVGKSDLGVNRQRVDEIRRMFEAPE